MYFINKLYQTTKGIVAVSGVTGSLITIVYGSLSGGTVFIIGGGLCMINAVFNLYEIGKVTADVREEIERLTSFLDGYIQRSSELYQENHVNKRYTFVQTKENENLRALLQKSDLHIEKLQELQRKILNSKYILAAEARELKERYERERELLSGTVREIREHLQKLEGSSDEIQAVIIADTRKLLDRL